MSSELPVAEIFESIQGEGTYVGTPMLFIRLAGCNVGKLAKALKVEGPFPLLPSGSEAKACCTFDGRIFPCDTDYELRRKVSFDEIRETLIRSRHQHVCVTGGEPFLHAELLKDFYLDVLSKRGIIAHIETSGTIQPKWTHPNYWITCAPKLNAQAVMIVRADELKILVDENFDERSLTPEMFNHRNVYLCPVNEVSSVDMLNVGRCLELLKQYPNWKLSVQLHKFLGLR